MFKWKITTTKVMRNETRSKISTNSKAQTEKVMGYYAIWHLTNSKVHGLTDLFVVYYG